MKVFLSSTYEDLIDYRGHVLDVLVGCEMIYKGMEFFGASEHDSLDLCLSKIDESELIICLLGTRYGSKPPGSQKSFTHHEIDRAIELKRPVLVYVLDEERQPVYKKFIDQGEDEASLTTLKTSLMTQYSVERFTTPENLAMKIARDLSKRFSSSEQSLVKVQERVASRYRECAYDFVAEWYDRWYEGHWENDEPFKTICAVARSYWESTRYNISKIKILDCACGTGNTFATFTKAGYQIFGTDGSREMLARAFSNCKATNIATDHLISEPLNWTDLEAYLSYFDRDSFDLIVNTGNSFCHIPPTPEYMRQALSTYYALLKPGGQLLIDTKKYVRTSPISDIPTYMELKYDTLDKEWQIRTERKESREIPGLG